MTYKVIRSERGVRGGGTVVEDIGKRDEGKGVVYINKEGSGGDERVGV
jgi:hypothetical protein